MTRIEMLEREKEDLYCRFDELCCSGDGDEEYEQEKRSIMSRINEIMSEEARERKKEGTGHGMAV